MSNWRPKPRWGRKEKRLPIFYPALVLFLAVMIFLELDSGTAEKIAIDAAMVQTSNMAADSRNQGGSPLPVAEDYSLDIETINLHRKEQGINQEISLENYIVGVVAGEMPTTFAFEALKAQSVIARTYAAAVISQGGELCDDPGHCQCYYDPDSLKQMWGDSFEEKYTLCVKAVEETKGEVILYSGEIAKTFFHSTCGGQTSSAAEVWGEDIPYLQSVDCSWDRDAPRYQETVTLSVEELPYLLNIDGGSDVPVTAGLTNSGRVESVAYGGRTIKATDFRKSLTLNSTNFSIEPQGDKVVISTKGFGHGVGLCQYGADGMAKEGNTYRQIIDHYYTGVQLGKIVCP